MEFGGRVGFGCTPGGQSDGGSLGLESDPSSTHPLARSTAISKARMAAS